MPIGALRERRSFRKCSCQGAWQGEARHGSAGLGEERGSDWQGWARHGKEQGKARRGMARPGMARIKGRK